MPARARGSVRLEKIQVGLPEGTYRDIEQAVKTSGQWMSVVDFLREAAKEKLERWKAAGHSLPEGPGPAGVVEEVRAREGATARRRGP